MKIHVRRECDPTRPTNTGSLCSLTPAFVQTGYNPEWDLVYRLDTLQAVRRQDVCPACLRAIETYKKKHGMHPKLP